MVTSRRPQQALVGLLGSGAVGGLGALVVERAVMTCATAALGAWVVVSGVAFFLVGPEFLDTFREPLALGEHRAVLVGSWSVLAAGGALAQFATHKKRKNGALGSGKNQ